MPAEKPPEMAPDLAPPLPADVPVSDETAPAPAAGEGKAASRPASPQIDDFSPPERRASGELSPAGRARALAMAWYAEALRLERDLGTPMAALPAYRKVVELDSQFVPGHLKIALALLSQDQNAEALAHLENALAANPQSHELRAAIAYAHRQLDHNDEALRQALAVIRESPDVIMPYRVVFEIYAERDGDAEAVRVLEKTVGARAKDPAFWTNLGRVLSETLSREGRLTNREIAERVLPIFQRAGKTGAKDQAYYIQLANCHVMLDKNDEAIQNLRKALRAGPPTVELYLRLANLLRIDQRLDEAIAMCEKAFALDPDYAGLGEILYQLYIQKDEPAKALPILEKIKNRHPGNGQVYVKLALHYSNAGRTKEAMDVLREGIRSFPQRLDLYELLARSYQAENQLPQAIRVLERAIRRAPTAGALYLQIADLYERTNQPEQAVANYEQAISLGPRDPLPLLRLALLHLQQGQVEESAKVIARARALFPSSARVAYIGALQARQAGDYALALERLAQTRSLAVGPEADVLNDRFVIELALNQELSGKLTEADKTLTAAAPNYPESQDLIYQLARVKMARKDHEAAAEVLASARTRFPDAARFAFLAAVNERERKNYARGLELLAAIEKAASKNSEVLSESYYLELGLMHELSGDVTLSEQTLQKGLAKHKDSPLLLNALAYLWAEQGSNLEQALAMSKKSLEADPKNGAYLDTLGWIYFKMGKPEEALPWLQQAAEATEHDPVVEQHLGEAYAKLGNLAKAIEIWEQILKADPQNKDVKALLDAAKAQASRTP